MSVVIYEKKGHIAHIRLNRPESLNAINIAMAKELIKIWNDIRCCHHLVVKHGIF